MSSAGFEVCRDNTGEGIANGIDVTLESGVGSALDALLGGIRR